MTTKLEFTQDINSFNAYAPPFTDTGFNTTLAANVAQSLIIPSIPISDYKRWTAVFSYSPGKQVFVANNATATVPGGAFSQSASDLLPTARSVLPGDTLSFITPDANSYVRVNLYATK